MELKLNISEAEFGTELKDVLDSLSHEEKKEIAKEVFLKCLNEVTDTQRTIAEKEIAVFKKIQENVGSYEKSNYVTAEQMRKHYKYQEYMRDTKSMKEVVIDEILKEAVVTFKSLATEMVHKDEELLKIWNATSEQIKQDFPKYIHDAMTYFFASHLDEIKMGMQNALMQANNAHMSLNNINQRLQGNY